MRDVRLSINSAAVDKSRVSMSCFNKDNRFIHVSGSGLGDTLLALRAQSQLDPEEVESSQPVPDKL